MKDLRIGIVSELVRLAEEYNRRKEDADLYFSVRAVYPGRHTPPYPEDVAGLDIEFTITYGIGPVGSETHHYGIDGIEFVVTDDRITGIVTRNSLKEEQRSPDRPLTERSIESLLKKLRAFCGQHLKEHPPLSAQAQRWSNR